MNSKFNGQQLKDARMYRKYTIKDLASEVSLSTQVITMYEKSNTTPSPENMAKIANILQFPIPFFFIEPTELNFPPTTYYRKRILAKKADVAAQTFETNLLKRIFSFTSTHITYPKLNIINGAKQTPEAAAKKLREKWGLGLEPISDIQDIIENNGIILTATDMVDKIDAYSTSVAVNRMIVTSKQNLVARTNFNIAHELGHIILHDWDMDLSTLPNDDFKALEKQADRFASEFLFPTDAFKSELVYSNSLKFYYILKKKWGISVQAMLYKAMKLNFINEWQYINLLKNVNRKQEDDDTPYNFNKGMLQEAFDILKKKFGLTCLIKMINDYGIHINIEELENLLCLKKGYFAINNTKKIKPELKLIK